MGAVAPCGKVGTRVALFRVTHTYWPVAGILNSTRFVQEWLKCPAIICGQVIGTMLAERIARCLNRMRFIWRLGRRLNHASMLTGIYFRTGLMCVSCAPSARPCKQVLLWVTTVFANRSKRRSSVKLVRRSAADQGASKIKSWIKGTDPFLPFYFFTFYCVSE